MFITNILAIHLFDKSTIYSDPIEPISTVTTSSTVTNVSFTADETSILVTTVEKEVLLFSFNKTGLGEAKNLDNTIAEALGIYPQPKNPKKFALLLANGLVVLGDINGSLSYTPLNDSSTQTATAFSWTPGNHSYFIAGPSELIQFKDSKKLRSFTYPPLQDQKVISINAVDENLVQVVFTGSNEVSVFLVKINDDGFTWESAEVGNCYGDFERTPCWYGVVMRNWISDQAFALNHPNKASKYVFIVASAQSADVEIFNENEVLCAEEDYQKAALDFCDDGELSPLGVALDFSSTKKIEDAYAGMEESYEPLPILWLLDNRGMIYLWHIVNKPAIVEKAMSLNGLLQSYKKEFYIEPGTESNEPFEQAKNEKPEEESKHIQLPNDLSFKKEVPSIEDDLNKDELLKSATSPLHDKEPEPSSSSVDKFSTPTLTPSAFANPTLFNNTSGTSSIGSINQTPISSSPFVSKSPVEPPVEPTPEVVYGTAISTSSPFQKPKIGSDTSGKGTETLQKLSSSSPSNPFSLSNNLPVSNPFQSPSFTDAIKPSIPSTSNDKVVGSLDLSGLAASISGIQSNSHFDDSDDDISSEESSINSSFDSEIDQPKSLTSKWGNIGVKSDERPLETNFTKKENAKDEESEALFETPHLNDFTVSSELNEGSSEKGSPLFQDSDQINKDDLDRVSEMSSFCEVNEPGSSSEKSDSVEPNPESESEFKFSTNSETVDSKRIAKSSVETENIENIENPHISEKTETPVEFEKTENFEEIQPSELDDKSEDVKSKEPEKTEPEEPKEPPKLFTEKSVGPSMPPSPELPPVVTVDAELQTEEPQPDVDVSDCCFDSDDSDDLDTDDDLIAPINLDLLPIYISLDGLQDIVPSLKSVSSYEEAEILGIFNQINYQLRILAVNSKRLDGYIDSNRTEDFEEDYEEDSENYSESESETTDESGLENSLEKKKIWPDPSEWTLEQSRYLVDATKDAIYAVRQVSIYQDINIKDLLQDTQETGRRVFSVGLELQSHVQTECVISQGRALPLHASEMQRKLRLAVQELKTSLNKVESSIVGMKASGGYGQVSASNLRQQLNVVARCARDRAATVARLVEWYYNHGQEKEEYGDGRSQLAIAPAEAVNAEMLMLQNRQTAPGEEGAGALRVLRHALTGSRLDALSRLGTTADVIGVQRRMASRLALSNVLQARSVDSLYNKRPQEVRGLCL